jgi:segregation and condensation protein B
MSLKARIEAVIYAAEEPVTLAQLASLFRDEALLSRAARTTPSADLEAPNEAAFDAQPELAPEPGEDPLPTTPAITESLDADIPPAPSVHEGTTPAAEGADPGPEAQSADREGSDAEKKAARLRDREVREEIRALIHELIADFNSPDSGLEIREVAGGFRIGTRPECHDAVRSFIKTLKPPLKLSLQALETLAVIAYKQPVTAPEIGEIRGVDSSGVLGSLVARKLITTAGRKQVVGRPILYKTTKEFLLRFGLKDVNELPSIEEFEKMATELADTDLADTDLADSEPASEQAAFASSEENLPFPQNEIAAIEEAETEPSSPGSENSPPMQEPEPKEPEPPIHVPEPEPEPAPASEPSLAQHAENFRS